MAIGKRTILAADGSTVRTVSSYNNPYGYTSRRHDDESGLMYFRARYYDTSTGEFTSQDPLEYVDGMSLYRAYFVPDSTDPLGEDVIDVQPKSSRLKKVGCSGGERKFSQTWAFKVPPQEGAGWVVQKVTVRAIKGNCSAIKLELPILGNFGCCGCELTKETPVKFTYFEAWVVNPRQEYPRHPRGGGRARTPKQGTDRARFKKHSTFLTNSCGSYIQRGEIKFFSDSQVNGAISNPLWSNNPITNRFGPEPWTTESGNIWATRDKPSFWNQPAIASGNRKFSVRWRCCDCDESERRKIWANATPTKEEGK